MSEHVAKSLGDLLDHDDREQLVLPKFNETSSGIGSVIELFDSIYRGIPIDHTLVRKARQAVQPKAFANRRPPKAYGRSTRS